MLLVPLLLYFLSPRLPLVQYEQKQLLLPFSEGVKLSAKSKQFFHQWCSRFMPVNSCFGNVMGCFLGFVLLYRCSPSFCSGVMLCPPPALPAAAGRVSQQRLAQLGCVLFAVCVVGVEVLITSITISCGSDRPGAHGCAGSSGVSAQWWGGHSADTSLDEAVAL